jgi:hypothetical protein
MRKRSILIHGLGITLRRLPALLWTYFFNLGLAILFSLGLHHSLSSILDHSFASQRLVGAFDLGTVTETIMHLHEGPSGGAAFSTAHTGIFAYLAIYFLLVPGTLFCPHASEPSSCKAFSSSGASSALLSSPSSSAASSSEASAPCKTAGPLTSTITSSVFTPSCFVSQASSSSSS